MFHMGIHLLPIHRYPYFSVSFSVISMCITRSFSDSIDISPTSPCTYVSFYSIGFFWLLSLCSSFTQSSITTGYVSSGNSSITSSEAPQLVSVSFSFIFLCTTYSFSVSIYLSHSSTSIILSYSSIIAGDLILGRVAFYLHHTVQWHIVFQ